MSFNNTHHNSGALHHAIHHWHQGGVFAVVNFGEETEESS
jgi:hypothetical protein